MRPTRLFKPSHLIGAIALASAAHVASAADFPEVEPNGTKAEATVVNGMAPGDTISGLSQGTSVTAANTALTSADTFDITTTAAPVPGIYRYRLEISTTGTVGHTGSIRGLSQSASGIGTTDNFAQTSQNTADGTLPARTVQWYASEQPSRIYFRITGSGQTTSPYTLTLSRSPVTPSVVPMSFEAGPLRIDTVGQTSANTDMWLYSSAFAPIVDAGNDRSTVAQCRLDRSMAAGTYIASIGLSNLMNNLASPADEGDKTQTVLDFPNALCVNASAAGAQDCDFVISNRCSGASQSIVNQTSERFEITFWQFTLTGATLPDPYVFVAGSASPTNVLPGTSTLLTATAPAGMPGPVTVSLTAFGLGANVAMHDDGLDGDVAAGDNIWSLMLNVPITQAGGPYTVTVSGPAGTCVSPTVGITFTVNPLNDACANATPIVVGGTYSGTTLGATSSGDSGPACNTITSGNPAVWYTFTETSPVGRRLVAHLCDPATNFDAKMLCYTGSCGAFTCIMGNDTSYGCPFQNPARDSRANVVHTDIPIIANWAAPAPGNKCTVPGTTYYICVMNFSINTGGNFVLHLEDTGEPCEGNAPSNDLCANAKVMASFPYWHAAHGTDSTADIDVTCNHISNTNSTASVWYQITPSQPGELFHSRTKNQITEPGITGTPLDTVLTVFTGAPDCSNLTEVACVDGIDTYPNLFVTPVATLTAGTTYYMMVSNYNAADPIPTAEWVGFDFHPSMTTTDNCCRGTTCNPVAAGTCTGTVAGSASLVVTSCGAGATFASCCHADFNHDGVQSIDDLFLYFNAYFTGSPWANVGGDGVATPTIDDLFLYINAYFGTCS